jgi:hypothetical protein
MASSSSYRQVKKWRVYRVSDNTIICDHPTREWAENTAEMFNRGCTRKWTHKVRAVIVTEAADAHNR